MKLSHFITFNGVIECLSGLHIGGSTEGIEIGGIDNPVIKHPITKEPYIPGSSLKGKMRSSLEKKHGNIQSNDGEPCKCGECIICRIFGAHKPKNIKLHQGPTRIIFRDGELTTETKEFAQTLLKDKGQIYIESKWENTIDRINSKANPRQMERVPSGAKFNMEIVLQVFDIDITEKKEEEMISLVKEGLQLIAKTYLGGYGSRGSGQVKFSKLTMNGIPFTLED